MKTQELIETLSIMKPLTSLVIADQGDTYAKDAAKVLKKLDPDGVKCWNISSRIKEGFIHIWENKNNN